jgi:hypothetical protein
LRNQQGIELHCDPMNGLWVFGLYHQLSRCRREARLEWYRVRSRESPCPCSPGTGFRPNCRMLG